MLFLLFLGLLATRRWPQFASPQVWDEEGVIIKGYIEHGWLEVFYPINGYLLMVPKMIAGISLAISLYSFPAIATALAAVFTALVGVAIAMSPTHLKGRALCALATFAVPSDPEVFGTSLYTFWWAALLLFLLAVWDERKPALGLRFAFLLVGGLSSPVIEVMLPVFYFRAIWFRAIRAEKWVAVAATVVAAVQFYFTVTNPVQSPRFPPLASIGQHVIPKFFGAFLIGNLKEHWTTTWVLGLWVAGLFLLGLVFVFTTRDRRNVTAWTLFFLLGAAVGLSVARLDPAIPHPRLAGPRYFFYPFVITSWALIQGLFPPQLKTLRGLAAAMVALALVNAIPAWRRGIVHDDLRWADHVRSSALFPAYAIPVQLDGNRFLAWSIRESGDVWRRVIDARRLVSAEEQAALPTFAYRVVDFNDPGPGVGVMSEPRPRKPIVGVTSPSTGKQEIILPFKRGDRVYFRSGPEKLPAQMRVVGAEQVFIADLPLTADWVTVEFSNSKLPESFTLRIVDEGNGVGEWAHIEPSN